MKRYWYKTKKPNKISGVREMRVFTQYPHGYDVFIGETIRRENDSQGKPRYIHTLYEGKSDRIIKEFDDTGNCGFSCSRDVIEDTLDSMLITAGQKTRKARKTHSAIKRKPKINKKKQ